MIDRIERRVLSTGDVLVFTAALASLIFVGRAQAHRLGEGPAALADARALVASGEARELTGAQVQQITNELRAIGLLMPGPDRT
jgi:hypothetical protein